MTAVDKVVVEGSPRARNLVVNTDGIHIGVLEYTNVGTDTQRLESDSGKRTLKIDTLIHNGSYTVSVRNNNEGTLAVEVGNLIHTSQSLVLGQNFSLASFTVTGSSTIASAATVMLAGVDTNVLSLGHLDLEGIIVLGAYGYSTGTLAVHSLKGNAGTIRVSSSSAHSGTAGTLLISGSNTSATSYSGLLQDYSNVNYPAVLTVQKSGSNIQILSRSAGNTYSGGTTIDGGTLAVTNASGSGLGTGAVVVKAGGALAGSGIVAPGAGNGITIESGGSIAPSAHLVSGLATLTLNGSNTGAAALLTLEEGASFTFRLGADDTSDRIAFTGYSAGKLSLSEAGVAVHGLDVQEGTYTLFTFNSISEQEIATLTSLLRMGEGFDGYNVLFSWSGSHIEMSVLAVPEPSLSGLVLLGLGTAGVLTRYRRRIVLS